MAVEGAPPVKRVLDEVVLVLDLGVPAARAGSHVSTILIMAGFGAALPGRSAENSNLYGPSFVGIFYRLLAWPNGIAMAALVYSLWQSTRTSAPARAVTPSRLATTGVV